MDCKSVLAWVWNVKMWCGVGVVWVCEWLCMWTVKVFNLGLGVGVWCKGRGP